MTYGSLLTAPRHKGDVREIGSGDGTSALWKGLHNVEGFLVDRTRHTEREKWRGAATATGRPNPMHYAVVDKFSLVLFAVFAFAFLGEGPTTRKIVVEISALWGALHNAEGFLPGGRPHGSVNG